MTKFLKSTSVSKILPLFYNWTAATLGSGTTGIVMDYGDAPDSICPRGWKMPSAVAAWDTPSGEWRKLLNTTYDIPNGGGSVYNKASNWPLNFLPTGGYSNGRIDDWERTREGNWWSIAEENYGLGYYLSVQNVGDADDGVNQSYTRSGFGLAIRCVVRS